MYHGVTHVQAADGYRLLLCFDNGEHRIFDVTPLLDTGRFAELKNPELFKTVAVSFDTIEWKNGLDLDPEYLYAKSVGAS